jgi:hypothetical protein
MIKEKEEIKNSVKLEPKFLQKISISSTLEDVKINIYDKKIVSA